MATAAMINNKVTTNDWFLGFTVPPNDNSSEDYTNMSISGIAPQKILYISLIYHFSRHTCPCGAREGRSSCKSGRGN
jgi:hypothetical protein